MTTISRKKFMDAPIGLAVGGRTVLRDRFASEHGFPLDEQEAGGAYLWRCPEGCLWEVTFASLAEVATWLTVTFGPGSRHADAEGEVGCRLSRGIESFSSEIESQQRTGGRAATSELAAPTDLRWGASGVARAPVAAP